LATKAHDMEVTICNTPDLAQVVLHAQPFPGERLLRQLG